MRYVKYFLIAVIAIILITVAFANRQVVSLTVLPQGLEPFIGLNAIVGPIQMPLYAVVFAGVAAGLTLGFLVEWIRESKHRRAAEQNLRKQRQLEAQVRKMKAKENAGKDELIVLVEDTAAAR